MAWGPRTVAPTPFQGGQWLLSSHVRVHHSMSMPRLPMFMSSTLCPCSAPRVYVQYPMSMSSTPWPCPAPRGHAPAFYVHVHMWICPASCNLCGEEGFALIFCSLLCCASNIASKIMLSWEHVGAHSWHLSRPFLSFKPEQKDSWEGSFWISFEFQRTTLLLCFKPGSNSG